MDEEISDLALRHRFMEVVMSGELVSVAPEEAVGAHLEDVRVERRWDTYQAHKSVLDRFIEWIESPAVDLENLNELDGSHLQQFKQYLRARDNQTISLNGALSTFRVFIKFCERNEYVTPGLVDKVPVPNVSEEDEVRSSPPPDELVYAVHDYCDTHEYASRRHVEYEIIRELSVRCGAVRALDVEDHDYENQVLRFRDRPEGPDEKGTPLKNKSDSNRNLNISNYLNELIKCYQESDPNRKGNSEVIDEYGRRPLLTREDNQGNTGRPSTTTIQRDLYKLFRPCEVGLSCPDDRDPESCEATKNAKASQCPGTTSPHPLRTWSIMHQLDGGVSKELLSDRADVSVPVLEKHYDQRSKERKRIQRKEELADALPRYSADTPSEIEVSDNAEDGDGSVDHPSSPIELTHEWLASRITVPTLIRWLWEDVRATRNTPWAEIPRAVSGYVILYVILTVLFETASVVG